MSVSEEEVVSSVGVREKAEAPTKLPGKVINCSELSVSRSKNSYNDPVSFQKQ